MGPGDLGRAHSGAGEWVGRGPARLVGALVALALAVGVLPWLLSDSGASTRPEVATAAPVTAAAISAGPVRNRAAELLDGLWLMAQLGSQLAQLDQRIDAVAQTTGQTALRRLQQSRMTSSAGRPASTKTTKTTKTTTRVGAQLVPGTSSAPPLLTVTPMPQPSR